MAINQGGHYITMEYGPQVTLASVKGLILTIGALDWLKFDARS